MAAVFDLSDDSVVLAIGSGAGGETLRNELAQNGIDVVCLEAGPRLTLAATADNRQGRAVYETAGAIKVCERGPFPSGHDVGTCRMSANSCGGVVNALGQTYDVPNPLVSDGGQFTGTAENPTRPSRWRSARSTSPTG